MSPCLWVCEKEGRRGPPLRRLAFLAVADDQPAVPARIAGQKVDADGHAFAVLVLENGADLAPAAFSAIRIVFDVEQVADGFGMSKGQLAQTAGLARETLYRSERSATVKTQGRLREMLEIISRVTDWAGGKEQAMAWYRAQPLPAFGGRTAEALVKEGKAAAVRDYLDHMAVGGFA